MTRSSATIALLLMRRRVLLVLLLLLLFVHGKNASAMSATTNSNNNNNKRIVLWNSGTCPYAQRAWIALLEKQVDFEHRLVDLQNKPADFVSKYAAAIGTTDVSSVRAKVPLLEYGDETLVVESEDVIKFIGQTMGTNDDMYPSSANDTRRARIESFIKAFERTIQGYYKFMTATNEDEANEGKLEFCTALHALAPHIETPPFCLGETFSVAECYAAPFLHRYQATVPYFRGVSMSGVMLLLQAKDEDKAGKHNNNNDNSIDKVTAWMNAVCNRPSVLATNAPSDHLLKTTRGYFIKYVSPKSPAALEE
jgi:glutathione S-transferase